MGFDLLTGVFVLAPLALLDKRPGVTAATGNRIAPISGEPVWTAELIANTAANARIAPAINALIKVSLVDMKIFDSPASTILVTNSAGTK
jgi:hypothetical protein